MNNERLNYLLTQQPILLFDGECGFCNRSVLFFLRREKNKKMHFAALESEEGKALRNYFEIDDKIDSIILIKDNEAHIKSCAALRMTWYMKGAWPLLSVFMIIPPFLRNIVYDLIARRRKSLFGKVESCSLLEKEDQERFLDKSGSR
jgi:predicted DCC family thiol-disulfide oxidoreductase YuxK